MRDRATQAMRGFRRHSDADVVGHQIIGLLILAVTTLFARRLETRSGAALANNII